VRLLAACHAIGRTVGRRVTVHGLKLAEPMRRGWSWPAARRYLLARVLPVRHLASVAREHDQFRAACVCGWDGEWHPHQGAAFSEAHVHTKHVYTAIHDPTATAP
jgi:hypothetical protein